MKLRYKILFGIISLLALLILVAFLYAPAFFTNGRTLTRYHVDFNNELNFDNYSKDIYRKVIEHTYMLEEEPFYSFSRDGMDITVYLVEEWTMDASWPHDYLANLTYPFYSQFDRVCSVVKRDGEIISKDCNALPFDKDSFIVLPDGRLSYDSDEGTSFFLFDVVDLTDEDQEGWDVSYLEHLRNRYQNDEDYLVWLNHSYYKKQAEHLDYELLKLSNDSIESTGKEVELYLGDSENIEWEEVCVSVKDNQGNTVYGDDGYPLKECYIELVYNAYNVVYYDPVYAKEVYLFRVGDEFYSFSEGLSIISLADLKELLELSEDFDVLEFVLE